jgi:hypothetical protein
MTSCASRGRMNSERRRVAVGARAATWLGTVVIACADFSRGDPPPFASEPRPDAATGTSFAAHVHSVLIEGCESCHTPDGAASSTELVYTGDVQEDYSATLQLVSPDSPEASRLMTKMQGRGHGGGAIFTPASAQYVLVLTWIREGAAP